MESHITPQFRKLYKELPPDIRKHAKAAFRLWKSDPTHPSLFFKRIKGHTEAWSVRIGLSHRAIGKKTGEEVIWSWIGSHTLYDRMM